jgi:hypothetical protein
LMAALRTERHNLCSLRGIAREIWRKGLSLPMGMLSITVSLGKQSLQDSA